MYLKNLFKDNDNNKKNNNKELFLCFENYIIYSIFWVNK